MGALEQHIRNDSRCGSNKLIAIQTTREKLCQRPGEVYAPTYKSLLMIRTKSNFSLRIECTNNKCLTTISITIAVIHVTRPVAEGMRSIHKPYENAVDELTDRHCNY